MCDKKNCSSAESEKSGKLLEWRIDIIFSCKLTGAPNEKNVEKRFKCSFLLSHIILRSFKWAFVRANTNRSVRMW